MIAVTVPEILRALSRSKSPLLGHVFNVRRTVQCEAPHDRLPLRVGKSVCHLGVEEFGRHRIYVNPEWADLARAKRVKPIIEDLVAAISTGTEYRSDITPLPFCREPR